MAHPCILCGSECYCHGDIDDCIVSKTPALCDGCGCEEFAEDQGWNDRGDDDDYEDLEDEPVGWECLSCGASFGTDPGDNCPHCTAASISPYG